MFLTKASLRNAISRKFGRNWSSYYFLLEISLYNVLSNIIYYPSHRQTGTPFTNITTRHSVPALCTNVSFVFLFGRNGNSYTIRTQSDTCVCVCVCVYIYIYIYIYIYTHTHAYLTRTHTHTHTHSSQYRDADRVKEITNWESSECPLPRKYLHVLFWPLVLLVRQPCFIPFLYNCVGREIERPHPGVTVTLP